MGPFEAVVFNVPTSTFAVVGGDVAFQTYKDLSKMKQIMTKLARNDHFR